MLLPTNQLVAVIAGHISHLLIIEGVLHWEDTAIGHVKASTGEH